MAHSIGKTIAELRKQYGWTQMELAKKLNVSDKTISKWENEGGFPEITQLPSLAKIFNVSIDYLMSGKTNDTNAKAQSNDSDISAETTISSLQTEKSRKRFFGKQSARLQNKRLFTLPLLWISAILYCVWLFSARYEFDECKIRTISFFDEYLLSSKGRINFYEIPCAVLVNIIHILSAWGCVYLVWSVFAFVKSSKGKNISLRFLLFFESLHVLLLLCCWILHITFPSFTPVKSYTILILSSVFAVYHLQDTIREYRLALIDEKNNSRNSTQKGVRRRIEIITIVVCILLSIAILTYIIFALRSKVWI